MLTKAILTGGVLSVLAGSIVYFGTEGADALESDARKTTRVEETELAGGSDEPIAAVELEAEAVEVKIQEPPKETSKPKTKWLDQYLKKSKPEAKPQPQPKPDVEDVEIEVKIEEIDEQAEIESKPNEKKPITVETRVNQDGARGTAKGTYIVSEGSRIETVDIEALGVEALNADGDIDIDALVEELGLESEKNVQIRVVKKMDRPPSRFDASANASENVDYDTVIAEAKKLLVTVGLAKRGDTKAAFAVLEELEIDELSAPIRLEIITALMATRQERKNFGSQ